MLLNTHKAKFIIVRNQTLRYMTNVRMEVEIQRILDVSTGEEFGVTFVIVSYRRGI